MLGGLCEKYQVNLVSDDIHADVIFSGHRYHPLISISETLNNNTIQEQNNDSSAESLRPADVL